MAKGIVYKDWLVVARDKEMQGFRIIQLKASTIKDAYTKATHTFVMEGWGLPDGMSAIEWQPQLEEGAEQGKLLVRVFDACPREGLFNGMHPLFETEKSWKTAAIL